MQTDLMDNAVLSAKATSANKLVIERGAGNRELPGGRAQPHRRPAAAAGQRAQRPDLVVSTETSDAARIDRAAAEPRVRVRVRLG